MDNISTKNILIAVGIFIIIVILSVFVYAYSSVQDIYESVNATNISIKDEFDDITTQYNNTICNGVDLVNTIKKYENSEDVIVVYPNSDIIQKHAKPTYNKTEATLLTELMKDPSSYPLVVSELNAAAEPHEYFFYTKYNVNVSIETDGKYKIEFGT